MACLAYINIEIKNNDAFRLELFYNFYEYSDMVVKNEHLNFFPFANNSLKVCLPCHG